MGRLGCLTFWVNIASDVLELLNDDLLQKFLRTPRAFHQQLLRPTLAKRLECAELAPAF